MKSAVGGQEQDKSEMWFVPRENESVTSHPT